MAVIEMRPYFLQSAQSIKFKPSNNVIWLKMIPIIYMKKTIILLIHVTTASFRNGNLFPLKRSGEMVSSCFQRPPPSVRRNPLNWLVRSQCYSYLNGKSVNVLWDTGSMMTLVSRKWAKDNFPEKKIHFVSEFLEEDEEDRLWHDGPQWSPSATGNRAPGSGTSATPPFTQNLSCLAKGRMYTKVRQSVFIRGRDKHYI